MSKSCNYRGLIVYAVLLPVLAACGDVNMSGDPEIVAQAEIVSEPTHTLALTGQEATQTPSPMLTSTPSISPVDTSSSATNALSSASPTPVKTGDTLIVRGILIQGTRDADPDFEGLEMNLSVLDEEGTSVGDYQTTAAADSTFVFEGVTRAAGHIYLVYSVYGGILQGTQVPSIEGTEDELSVEVTLYERTTDPSSVAVTHVQMLMNYAPIEESFIEVRLDIELMNNSDRIVASDRLAERGWPISVEVELPVGAFNIYPMEAEGSERYQVQTGGTMPVVEDTWPLQPGESHTITVLYYLPYAGGAVLDQSFGYPVMNAVVLLPNDTVTFESEQFDTTGEFRYRVVSGGLRVTELKADETIDPKNDTTLIQAFDLLQPLRADERMIFSLNGRPTRTANVMPPTNQPDDSTGNTLVLILGGMGLGVLLVAGVMFWRQYGTSKRSTSTRPYPALWQPPAPSAGKDAILKAIATLDQTYEAGWIDAGTYAERRAILKERLIPLLKDDPESSPDA